VAYKTKWTIRIQLSMFLMKVWSMIMRIRQVICSKKNSRNAFKSCNLLKKKSLSRTSTLKVALVNTKNLISAFFYFWIKKRLTRQTLSKIMRLNKVSLREARSGVWFCLKWRAASSLTDLECSITRLIKWFNWVPSKTDWNTGSKE
jgi:hypothetical protein